MKTTSLCFALLLGTCFAATAQDITLRGQITDDRQGNLLDETVISLYEGDRLISVDTESDREGRYILRIPGDGRYRLELNRPAYRTGSFDVDTKTLTGEDVNFTLTRLPGYEFIATIKKAVSGQQIPSEELYDTRIEIYNHQTGELELDLPRRAKAAFAHNMERGNRYTVMIRKEGYFAKRFDVVINVDGCILCFEGLGTQQYPNVDDDLTESGKRGVISTEILLREIELNKAIKIENIYYDFDKANIRRDARPPLNNLVSTMKATPIVVVLGSHTDSRGSDAYNLELSQRRAQSAVDYIISRGINRERITAQGYGETVPVNRCTNGVKCSDAEYQQNRRTEFTVTSFMQGSSFRNKTLKQIIEEEKATNKRAKETLEVIKE